jgi:hypothetical protein
MSTEQKIQKALDAIDTISLRHIHSDLLKSYKSWTLLQVKTRKIFKDEYILTYIYIYMYIYIYYIYIYVNILTHSFSLVQ